MNTEQCVLILDSKLRVVAASPAFSTTYSTQADDILNETLGKIASGAFQNPDLQGGLLALFSHDRDVPPFELGRVFPKLGPRTLLINASRLVYADQPGKHILMQIEDVTDRRALDGEKNELLRQKDFLLEEMNHRVSNSLQIIASILMLKARTVSSPETRRHLEDAHRRVVAVATVQSQLRPLTAGRDIVAQSYLTGLCESLSKSLINEDRAIAISVQADPGGFTTEQAVSVGLVTTELVINALKHAFPGRPSGTIKIRYESGSSAWRISVTDDGVGIAKGLSEPQIRIGLGTTILEALARQLGGHIMTSGNSPGTSVSLTVPRASPPDAQKPN
jgi:chemotaxis protein methyltransferase CheR